MNITDTHKTIAALAGTAVLAVGAVSYFQTKSEKESAERVAK